MGVGRFRTRVQFQNRTTTMNAIGEVTGTYTTFLTIGGDVRALSGNERQEFTGGVAEAADYLSITVPYRQSLETGSTDWVVVVDSRSYEVVRFDRSYQGNKYQTFIVRRDR